MPNLLLEIGTEELPLDSLDVLYADFVKKWKAVLTRYRVDFGECRFEATPRRIAFFVSGIALKQKDQILEFSGPSYEKAYDASRKPTPALEGFLKSKKAKLEDVRIKETPKGKFVLVTQKESGKPLSSVFPKMTEEALSSLSFPKLMRWEGTGFRFPRPIRWIAALLDRKILPLKLAGVSSSRQSRGHRFMGKSFSIPSADWQAYLKLLKHGHVTLSLEERKQTIKRALQSKFQQTKADPDLVHLNAQLVEEPYFIQGGFSKDYLKLPPEVLATCMKKHQKIFAVYDSKGKMQNRFAAVLNGKRAGLPRIVADFENVLESRLRDAKFFYEEDAKTPLAKRVDSLKEIVYLGKLGTMKAKAERLKKFACALTGVLGENWREDLVRAAELCKADLMTHLVYEMPELQGIIGGEYARLSGEKPAVAQAVRTQYLPKNLAEDYQSVRKQLTPLGALLGIIDRLDLLIGALGTGLEPTGSQDPFALRRAGGVLVKLIRAFKFHFQWKVFVHAAWEYFEGRLGENKDKLIEKLNSFLQERVLFELGVKPGTKSYEIAQAVFRSSFEDLADVFDRFEIMNTLYTREPSVFMKTAKVVERTANIIKGIQGDLGAVKPELFKDPMEASLFKVVEEKSGAVAEALNRKDYEKATRLFGQSFFEPVNEFFSKVMVNVEDRDLRRNRQALMKQIHGLYAGRLADLSLLSRIDQE